MTTLACLLASCNKPTGHFLHQFHIYSTSFWFVILEAGYKLKLDQKDNIDLKILIMPANNLPHTNRAIQS